MDSNDKKLEEDAGVLKSGIVTIAFSPVKSKKSHFAVIGDRALELYDNERSQKKRKPAKHLIDLARCFNISQHFDGRLKYCVSLMTPDETLLLKAETDEATSEWYDVLLSAMIPARALRLGRPVSTNEFFECAWDVILVEQPKIRGYVTNPEDVINICTKDPLLAGPKRLCFYPHTIILCRRGIEPVSAKDLPPSGYPPFKACDFVEFPRHYVANFGCQEKYFFMRMGRSSPSGSCEIWAMCESEEIAADVYRKINQIIERESEKRRHIFNGCLLRTNTGVYQHRERSHTHVGRQRLPNSAKKKSSVDEVTLRERRAQLRDCKAAADQLEGCEHVLPFSTSIFSFDTASTSNANWTASSAGCTLPRTRTQKRNGAGSQSCSDGGKSESNMLRRQSSAEHLPSMSFSLHRLSVASSSAAEETEDSGGTLRVLDGEELARREKTLLDRRIEATIERMLPPEMKEAYALKRLNYADGTCSSTAGSISTNDEGAVHSTPGDISEASADNLDYAPMDMNSWSSGSASHIGLPGEQIYNLEEVHSYLSDSSDSCYSSMAPNAATRANSFGTAQITQPQRHVGRRYHPMGQGSPASDAQNSLQQSEVIHRANKISSTTNTPQEDARKRAFSLGSKSWFQKPFRKFSRDFITRSHRLSNTSASSTGSTNQQSSSTYFPNATISLAQAHISNDLNPLSRVRSESIGSGRSTPSKHSANNNICSDHVAIDFGGTSAIGRSTSGSVHSVDSSTRSRTSSFCHHLVREPGDVVVHTADAEIDCASTSAPWKASTKMHEHCFNFKECSRTGDESQREQAMDREEYVLRDPQETNPVDSCVLAPYAVCSGYETLNTSNYSDPPSSQFFETIQESLSGRSTPASLRKEIDGEGVKCKEHEHTTLSIEPISQDHSSLSAEDKFIQNSACKKDDVVHGEPDCKYVCHQSFTGKTA